MRNAQLHRQSRGYDLAVQRFQRSGLAAAVACIALLTSCTSTPPPDAWVIAPIEYDNTMDGAVGRDMTDVTYPMPHIASDSVGGFWTESGGSWLHIDEDGEATRRFNLDGENAYLRVRGMASISPSQLVVSGHMDGEWEGGLWMFDTTQMAWTSIPTDGKVIGDVAVVGKTIFYVENLYDAAGDVTFVVRQHDDVAADPVRTPQLDVSDGDTVILSVEPDGTIIANTGTHLFAVDPAGEATEVSEFAPESPVSATSADGLTAWATNARGTDKAWYVEGGSSEARRLTEIDEYCGPRSIETSERQTSPPLCNIQAIEWLDSGTLIVSAGTEGGSVLATVRAP